MMKASDFIERALLAEALPSCYVTGCFGAPLGYPGAIDRYEREYPQNQKYDTLMRERAAAPEAQEFGCFGFDCINLIKGILYGWIGDKNDEYGGAKFGSNGVPDLTVSGFFDLCTTKSSDFTGIVPGSMLYYGNGSHCGIYIGSGYAVEATGKWERKVVISAVENLLTRYPEMITYERKRRWQAWGLIPFVDYKEETKMKCPYCGREIIVEFSKADSEGILAVHTVKAGESPWSIAVKYYGDGSKYPYIMDYNGLDRDAYIYGGQVLYIPKI